MTLAAIDRLVHHATIIEMNAESYRRCEAIAAKRGRGRPATHATSPKANFGRLPAQAPLFDVAAADRLPALKTVAYSAT